ncbi:hypothetical protein GQX74_014819 [Glossina fuscipes]|nr:hypothetical protein GQX74_014819 [Glossina fuscipes]
MVKGISLAVTESSVAVMKKNAHVTSSSFGSVSLRPSVKVTGPYEYGKAAINNGKGVAGSTRTAVTASSTKSATREHKAEKKCGAAPPTKVSAGNLTVVPLWPRNLMDHWHRITGRQTKQPTLRNVINGEVLDLAFASPCLSSSILVCYVSSAVSSSENQHIGFDIAAVAVSCQTYKDPKCTKWKMFCFLLSENKTRLPISKAATGILN